MVVHRWLLGSLIVFAATGTGGCADRSGSDSSGSSGATDSGSGGDPELTMLCEVGCDRFLECAPDAYQQAYVDDADCVATCEELFSEPAACRAAAGPYAQCTANLDCADWPDLLNDPATSPCATEWGPVSTSCEI